MFSSGQISQFYIDFYCLLPLNKLYLLLEEQVCFLCVFSVFLSFFMVGNALSLRCYMSYWGSKLKRLDMMYTKKLLNPYSAHCFLKFLKKCWQFCCTGLLRSTLVRSSKLVHLDGRKLASFTWNLVQSLMDLIFSSKNNRKWSKNG